MRRAAMAGVTHLAVTDHDSVAAIAEATAAGRAACVEIVPGIELTAQLHGREVHVLGQLLRAGCAGVGGVVRRAEGGAARAAAVDGGEARGAGRGGTSTSMSWSGTRARRRSDGRTSRGR